MDLNGDVRRVQAVDMIFVTVWYVLTGDLLFLLVVVVCLFVLLFFVCWLAC